MDLKKISNLIKSKRKAVRADGKAIKLSNDKILIYGGSNGEWANHKVDVYISHKK